MDITGYFWKYVSVTDEFTKEKCNQITTCNDAITKYNVVIKYLWGSLTCKESNVKVLYELTRAGFLKILIPIESCNLIVKTMVDLNPLKSISRLKSFPETCYRIWKWWAWMAKLSLYIKKSRNGIWFGL